MKTIKYFSMAALVAMGAIITGCVKEEPAQEQLAEDNIVVCTTTVCFGETKALTADGVKTFAPGETYA